MIEPTIDNTYGPNLIGCTVAGIFYGIVCAQMWHYFRTFRDDARWLKLTVALLWFLDSAHMVFVLWNVYYFTITHAVSLDFPNIRSWTSGALITTSNVSACIIRAVFMHRIWCLSHKSLMLTLPLGVMCFAAAGFGISYGIQMFSSTFGYSHTFSWLLYTTLSTEAASDLFISGVLFVLFGRLYVQVKSAHTLMHSLMLYSVNTGVLQSALALAVLVSYALAPYSGIYLAIFLVLPKAALNSLLAVLNARTQLRKMIPSPSLLGILGPPRIHVDVIVDPPLSPVEYNKPERERTFSHPYHHMSVRSMVGEAL